MPEDEAKVDEETEQMDYVADQADLDSQQYERLKAARKTSQC